MGDVPLSSAGAAPGLRSKLSPLTFLKSAGNLHLVFYCRALLTWQGLLWLAQLCAVEMWL